MNRLDTIVARATPHPPAAESGRCAPRAVLRLSGPDSFRAVDALLHPDHEQSQVRSALHSADQRLACFVRMAVPPHDQSLAGVRVLDLPAAVVLMPGPRSPTGEHCAELHLPASAPLLDRIIGVLCAPGPALAGRVRPAGPGEFTARAFLNGRLTLTQAEGVGALIGARTEAQRRAAMRLLSGEAGDHYRELADELAGLLALVEAGIDFTDQEDVVAITRQDLCARLSAMVHRLGELGAAPHAPRESTPLVALAGPPSAGKSTLFNALLGHERAITDAAPGTTRDALREEVDLRAHAWSAGVVTLADMAGLDAALAARSRADGAAQAGALALLREADVVVLCDPRADFGFWEALAGPGAPLDGLRAALVRVRTKADRAGVQALDPRAIPVCALDGWNLGALASAIAEAALGADDADDRAAPVPRHAIALDDTRRALRQALEVIDGEPASGPGTPAMPGLRRPELVAVRLREALDRLGELTGAVSPDQIIGRIFARFCIGK